MVGSTGWPSAIGRLQARVSVLVDEKAERECFTKSGERVSKSIPR